METSRSRIRWTRVVWIVTPLALIIAFLVCKPLVFPKPPPSPSPAWTPWIGLPAIDMAASSQHAREALFNLEQIEQSERGEASYDTLIRRCGEDSANGPDPQEIYVARMADSAFAGARGWRVQFSVEGDQVMVSIQDAIGGLLPPPPPLERGSQSSTVEHPHTAVKVVTFTKSQLHPIADAWRNTQLWDAPQETTQCSDGMPSILEACVHGQYAMRDRRCSGAIPQASTLWKSIQRLLPAPDAIGRPPGSEE